MICQLFFLIDVLVEFWIESNSKSPKVKDEDFNTKNAKFKINFPLHRGLNKVIIKLRTISTQEKFLGFGTSQLFHISFYTLNMLCMHTQVCQGWFLMCMRDWSKKKNRRQISQIDQMNWLWSTYLLVEHRFVLKNLKWFLCYITFGSRLISVSVKDSNVWNLNKFIWSLVKFSFCFRHFTGLVDYSIIRY